jgi:four helix bundle protein
MGLAKNFKELEVYKKAFKVSIDVHKQTLLFPDIEKYALSSQIRRASKSICANIAEGYSKQIVSTAEYRRFLYIAMGSANEMLVWADFCLELNYIDQEMHENWSSEFELVAKMINKLASSLN